MKRSTLTLEEFLELYANGDIEITSCETIYSDKDKTVVEVVATVIQPVDYINIDFNLKL